MLSKKTTSKVTILWIDCLGGLMVGFFVLLFCSLISAWTNLPTSIVISMALANLLYGSYSLYVTTRKSRSILLVKILAVANICWLFVCISIAVYYWQEVSALGLLHVIGEGIYVAALGLVEWRWKHVLSDEIKESVV